MWRAGAIVVVGALAGCGRIGFAPGDPGGSADSDGGPGASVDAASGSADAAPACVRGGPFGTPERLVELATDEDETGPHLSSDGRTIYFTGDSANQRAIYRATRPTQDEPFGSPVELTAFTNAFFNERDPWVSADHLSLVHVGVSAATAILEVASRAAIDDPFGDADTFAELKDAASGCDGGCNDSDPHLTADGLTIYFASDRLGLDDIFTSTRSTPTGTWDPPSVVADLSSSGYDSGPSLSPDGSQLLFARRLMLGVTYQIQVADHSGGAFTNLQPFAPVDADASQIDPAWSNDGTTIVYASSQAGGAGGFDLYQVRRACL